MLSCSLGIDSVHFNRESVGCTITRDVLADGLASIAVEVVVDGEGVGAVVGARKGGGHSDVVAAVALGAALQEHVRRCAGVSCVICSDKAIDISLGDLDFASRNPVDANSISLQSV